MEEHTMNCTINRLSRIASLLAIGSSMMIAQGVQFGTLGGTVRATDGSPIVGARVIANTAQGAKVTVTDSTGAWRISQMVPQAGVKISISAKGYIGAGAEARVNLDKLNLIDAVLKAITQTSATVEVVATTQGIDSSAVTTATNLSMDSINSIPVNNRSITVIAALSPGVSSDSNGIIIRGSQATQVQYLVDGADVMDPVTGGPSVRLNEEMLSEVQVITGAASAEYGRFTGGVVNTVTRSGGNTFEGTTRWDVSDNNWNAYNPLDRGANGKTTFKDFHSTIQQYYFSGPIIKDHLFFVVGYRTTSPMSSTPGSTTSGDFGGQSFVTTQTEQRKDIKLDYQINNDHKIFWQWNKTYSERKNIDYPTQFGYPSTTISTLSGQNDLFQYVTFGYLGTLTSRLTLDIRVNNKKETLGVKGGGQGPSNAPLWIDSKTNDVFDNGFFAPGGDSRPIKTGNISLNYFADAAGTHQIKTGYQYFESSRNSANAQTPSNYQIYFNGFAAPGNSAVANRVLTVMPFPGDPQSTDPTRAKANAAALALTGLEWDEPITGATTKNRADAIFVNDKWTVNSNWTFQLGLRWDKFTSKDDLGRENYSFSGVSPRLAAIYDFDGNARNVVSANYSVYNGQVIQGATDVASPAGNPIYRFYGYIGGPALLADGSLNRAAFNALPSVVDDPFNNRSTKIDPNLKAPQTTEISFDYKHQGEKGGVFTLNVTKRKWTNFCQSFKEKNLTDGIIYTTVKNDPFLTRDYFGIEATYREQLNDHFQWGGNVTISSLRGNFEGGQAGAAGVNQLYGAASTIPVNAIAPTGYLSADQPIKLNVDGTYTHSMGKGKFNIGLLGIYSGGKPYSLAGTGALSGAPSGYSSTYTKYFGDRGVNRFPDTYRVDAQIGAEYPIYRKITTFARLNITNLFNHQMLATVNTTASTNATGALVYGGSYGRPTSSSNYILARQLNLAGGFRF
jgi:outer membrane receptor protein involved in Fe transport